MRYEPDTCDYCGAETWCEYRSNGRPQCRGCKVVRFYKNVLFPPLGFTLMPWWEKCLRTIYGTVEPEDGRRQYRRAYCSVAKKNGKSFDVSGLAIYHLCMEVDLEPTPLEAYGAAAALGQAGIVFKSAARLVSANPDLQDILRVLPSTRRIVRRDGHGEYQVISADGDVQDGIEPSLAIVDELHRWKTNKAGILHDVITKGTLSRQQPITAQISTSGEEYECPLWEREHDRAIRFQAGAKESRRFYGVVYSADPIRHQREPEYWKSREARVAANPSHEDLGGFLRDEALVDERDLAIENPSAKPAFLRYNLNLKVNLKEEQVIDMHAWQQCGGGVDLREWPAPYDIDLLIRKWGLLERTCWAGVDISATTDLTALSFVFPPDGEEDFPWTILPFAWMPEKRIPIMEKSDKVPYSDWERRGFLTACPGYEIDTRMVRERIEWAAELFDLREICFDPYGDRTLRQSLVDEGHTCVEVRQICTRLNEPTRRLLGLYLDGKSLRHGNHPVLNFCASCAATLSDTNDLIRFTKPDRAKSAKRIDVMAATVTAMFRAVLAEPVSVYENRGVCEVGA